MEYKHTNAAGTRLRAVPVDTGGVALSVVHSPSMNAAIAIGGRDLADVTAGILEAAGVWPDGQPVLGMDEEQCLTMALNWLNAAKEARRKTQEAANDAAAKRLVDVLNRYGAVRQDWAYLNETGRQHLRDAAKELGL